MYCRSVWHRGVIITGRILHLRVVSADRWSQLSVNDGGGITGFLCTWSQIVPRKPVLDLHSHGEWCLVVPRRLVLDLSTLCLVWWRCSWRGLQANLVILLLRQCEAARGWLLFVLGSEHQSMVSRPIFCDMSGVGRPTLIRRPARRGRGRPA